MSLVNRDGSISLQDLIDSTPAHALGLVAWTMPPDLAANGAGVVSNPKGAAVWLVAGQVITYLSVPVTVAGASMTDAQLGIVDSGMNLVASTPTSPTAFNGTTGWVELALSTPFVVPATGLYYLVSSFAGVTKPTLSGIAIAGLPSSLALPGGKFKVISYSAAQGTLPNPWVPVAAGFIPVIVAR
jgi:hypothetical protein